MNKRIVVWFSAGAASACAAKLTLDKYKGREVRIAYCDTGSEHPDNVRFIRDCERWFGEPVIKLKSERYRSTWEVFKKRRFLVGPQGALCTTELKKMLRHAFQRPDDIQIFGYTADKRDATRANRFREQNFEVTLECPLIDGNLTKLDCLGMVSAVGIELPAMYRLGYQNNNCIGCVKGGAGYWNKIRVDFPWAFRRMAAQERELNASILRKNGERLFLDQLDPEAGRYEPLEEMDCGVLCEMPGDK